MMTGPARFEKGSTKNGDVTAGRWFVPHRRLREIFLSLVETIAGTAVVG